MVLAQLQPSWPRAACASLTHWKVSVLCCSRRELEVKAARGEPVDEVVHVVREFGPRKRVGRKPIYDVKVQGLIRPTIDYKRLTKVLIEYANRQERRK